MLTFNKGQLQRLGKESGNEYSLFETFTLKMVEMWFVAKKKKSYDDCTLVKAFISNYRHILDNMKTAVIMLKWKLEMH